MSQLLVTSKHDWRYERKFFLESISPLELKTLVKLHPAVFKEIYYQRGVNSLYFDTQGLDFYYANLEGNSQRKKIRLRWYEQLKAAQRPNLEIKIKSGLWGRKEISSFSDFDITDSYPQLENLQGTLFVTYQRQYFQSSDQIFRLTIDQDVCFYPLSREKVIWERPNLLKGSILELKYDKEGDDQADKISSFFPFRMTKSSKYTLGMQKTYSHL